MQHQNQRFSIWRLTCTREEVTYCIRMGVVCYKQTGDKDIELWDKHFRMVIAKGRGKMPCLIKFTVLCKLKGTMCSWSIEKTIAYDHYLGWQVKQKPSLAHVKSRVILMVQNLCLTSHTVLSEMSSIQRDIWLLIWGTMQYALLLKEVPLHRLM